VSQSISENFPMEEETHLSFRLVLLVIFGSLVLLVGFFSSLPIIFVSVPIMLLSGFTLLQLRRPELRKVRLTRTLERVQINEEETCRIRLEVTNTGYNDIPLLQIRDQIPVELFGDKTRNAFSITLRVGETRKLLYEVKGKYFGKYRIGPIILSSQDAAGLVVTSSKLDIISNLVVFPKTAGKLSQFTIGPKTTRPRPGEIPSRRLGSGGDYFTIRELLPGEYTKRINWKASARLSDESKLLANEFTSRQVAETLIILDCRSDFDNVKDKGNSITAFSVRAVMSISERLLRDKNRVGLLALGATSDRIAPSYGRRQFDRIALTLTRFSPGAKFFGEKTSTMIRLFFPRVSQVVLISPLMSEENLETAFDLARSASSFDLMIVSPNPLDFPLDRNSKLRLRKTREGRIALRLSELERKTSQTQLEAARAIVLDWHVLEPLEEVVSTQRQNIAKRVAQLARV
jgi:uncharacterized protein (DUF58 family)